jgi:hypothetical protein
MLKYVHAEFFGYPVLAHMPRKQLLRLHRVLRDHGVDFDRSETRADDYFHMWINQAYAPRVGTATSDGQLSEKVAALLPRWLVTEPLPPSSRDPLGLQADAAMLADQLLPGLTVFINRVGYFFFLSWALREINAVSHLAERQRRELLNRLERALVLCETLYHGASELDECRHQGQRMKRGLLPPQGVRMVGIPQQILKSQDDTGGYNLYRNALVSCGFWEEDDDLAVEGMLPYRLTEGGERLAEVFARRSSAQALFQWAQEGAGKRSIDRLQDWGEDLSFCTFGHAHIEKPPFLRGLI